MDTQNQHSSKLPPLRTYAKDLEAKRKEKGIAPEPEAVAAATPAPKESFLKKKPQVVSMPPIVAMPSKAKEVRRAPLPGSVKKITSANATSSNTTFIVDNEDAAAATIITDTKRDRFKLFPALIASVTKWFGDKKHSYQVKKQPKYTVPETSRRKGVIQKATSMTGKLATSDFSSIHERIRQRQEESEKEPSHTSWSAKTEPGFLLLETSKKAAVSNVQFVSRKSYRTSPEEIVVKKEAVPVVVPPAPVVVTVTPEPIVVLPEEEIEEVPVIIEEVAQPEVVIETVEDDEPDTIREKVSRLSTILHIDTNTLALGVSATVLVLTVLGTYCYFMLSEQEITSTEIVAVRDLTPIINSDLEEVVLSTITRESVFEALVEVRSSLDSTTQVIFLTENNEVVPPNLLLVELGILLEQNFSQNISQIHFGYTRGRQPFMLMQVTDLVTAKGGLLVWEETMGADINALYGITGAELQPKFIDASLGGVDVRVLKTESGSERLLYGVHENTVFIATNSADFTELLNLRTQ